MLFETKLINPLCTTNLGLDSWDLFIFIGHIGIEMMNVRPVTAILIARLYRCSVDDQRVLARALPFMISMAQQATAKRFIDPPQQYPNDGNILSLTIWNDFIGFDINENIKTNASFYNDFCIGSSVINKYNLVRTGPAPLCDETQVSTYNYILPTALKDVLYERNRNYWENLMLIKNHFDLNKMVFYYLTEI